MGQHVTIFAVISWLLVLLGVVLFFGLSWKSGDIGPYFGLLLLFIILVISFIIRIRTGSFVIGSVLVLFGGILVYTNVVNFRGPVQELPDLPLGVFYLGGGLISLGLGVFSLIKRFRVKSVN